MNFKRFISRSNPTIALKYDIIFLASRHLNDENTTNTVKHRMYDIHFSAAKRLLRKWSYH